MRGGNSDTKRHLIFVVISQCRYRYFAFLRSVITAFLLTAAGVCPGAAQDGFPAKPLKLIVPAPAGSFTDVMARLIADGMRAQLNESVVIDNRPGGGTNVGATSFVRSPNDGYTLFIASSSNTMNVSLYKKLAFDVTKDFQPVSMISSSSFILVVNPLLPIASVQDLISYAKTNPGTLNFASTGAGTANHLAAAMLESQAGIKVTIVYYKSSVDGITDILAGRGHAMFAPASSVAQHIEAETLRALAITSSTRSLLTPQIPTIIESGLRDYQVEMWLGLAVPRGTPRSIVDRLAAAANRTVASQDLQVRFRANGAEPVMMPVDDIPNFIKKDIDRWALAVQAASMQPAD